MDNFDAHKWFKKQYLGEGHTNDDDIVAKGDGIEITKKQMERLQKGYPVRLSNGSVLASPFVKEGHTEDKMERDMEAHKRSKLSPDELKKIDAMRAFYRGETDVLPANLKEDIRIVVDYDNRDDRTTELFLDNGDSVEIDVIELYDNLKENNPEDLDEIAFGAAGTDKRTGQVVGEIIELIRSTGVDVYEVMEELGQEFGMDVRP